MEYLKDIVQIIRNLIALPLLCIGAGCYWISEKITGQYYTWRADLAEQQTIINLRRSGKVSINRKGFRGYKNQ